MIYWIREMTLFIMTYLIHMEKKSCLIRSIDPIPYVFFSPPFVKNPRSATAFGEMEGLTTLTSIARRALAASSYSKNSIFRCYCSSPPPNHKLFVAGLSWSVDEKALLDAFSSFGEVTEVRILYDKHSGRSRGFGFVNFAKDDHAMSAKDAMDGKALLGRPLRISFALERVRGAPIVVPRVRSSAEANNSSN